MPEPPLLPHGVELVDHAVADRLGGACYLRLDDRASSVVLPDLNEVQRRSAIEHELEHHSVGVVHPPATGATMQSVERMVRREVRRRLVRPSCCTPSSPMLTFR